MDKKEEKQRLSQCYIYMYSTEHLPKKDKIRFYYALKGRDGRHGIVKRAGIQHLGRTVLFVSKNYERDVSEFLRYWNCSFTKKEVFTKE